MKRGIIIKDNREGGLEEIDGLSIEFPIPLLDSSTLIIIAL